MMKWYEQKWTLLVRFLSWNIWPRITPLDNVRVRYQNVHRISETRWDADHCTKIYLNTGCRKNKSQLNPNLFWSSATKQSMVIESFHEFWIVNLNNKIHNLYNLKDKISKTLNRTKFFKVIILFYFIKVRIKN